MAKRPVSKKKKCPVCGRVPDEKLSPFCSKRCADIDLAKWLGGDYRVPTNERPDEPKPDEDN